MRRVAFVVQRYGQNIAGGAESLCRSIAERLASTFKIEVLTTCARDYMTWKNELPAGEAREGGVTVRRFSVDQPRNVRRFNALSSNLVPRARSADPGEQLEWMRAQGPISTPLLKYLAREAYDVTLFFTYLYATTYFGLGAVRGPAILVPFGHDEWPIYFSMWNDIFARPTSIIFSSPEERAFLEHRFGTLKGEIIGSGVEVPHGAVDASTFRGESGIHEPFLLYVGRVDESKGCLTLAEQFIELTKNEESRRRLVFAGENYTPLPKHPRILQLGFLCERTKWGAIRASDAVIIPSAYESLSLAALEAWAASRPVIVNGKCAVLVGQSKRANGGLWYEDLPGLQAVLRELTPEVASVLGIQGQQYVASKHSWPVVIERYRQAIETAAP